MKHGTYQERDLLRQAFDLLLELRSRPEDFRDRLWRTCGSWHARESLTDSPSSLPSERRVLRVSTPASELRAARADRPFAH